MAAEASRDGFDVRTMEGGPEAVLADATRAILGRAERSREDQADETTHRALLQRGKRKARLFQFTKQKDADDYAALMTQQARGEIMFIENKDLISGTSMARFLDWVEYEKPVESVRADVTEMSTRFLSSLKAQRDALRAAEQAAAPKKPQRKPRAPKPRVVVDLEPMPSSFRSGVPKGADQ